MPPVVAIVGPTATGKTQLALKLAYELGGEIVACDSRTVYRYMDIGTAKPSRQDQESVRHFMLDVADPDETFTAGMYARQGQAALVDITDRGRLPIVCGGTGFYARALLEGLSIPRVPPQETLRAELAELASREGPAALHRKLAKLDPASAGKIGAADQFRLIRALEVCMVVGRPFSEVAKKEDSGWRTLWVGLVAEDRHAYRQTIRRRFHEQMEAGMLDEARFLLDRFGPCRSVINTVNYKQIAAYLAGIMTAADMEEAAVRHNYKLSRRQIMWFGGNPEVAWFTVDSTSADDLFRAVCCHVESFLGCA